MATATKLRTPKKSSSPPPREPVLDAATQYAMDVEAGRIIAGPHVRDACQRHLCDLKTAGKRKLLWDVGAANRVIRFFSTVLRLSGGQHEGKPFNLEPWQAFIVGSLFGWKWAETGFRRFNVAFVEAGKGSGKSPLAAGIGLYMLTADDEPSAEVYTAAVDKDQAMVLFRDAVSMVKQSPALSSRLSFSGGPGREWNVAFQATNSFFRPISSESQGRGKSGPRPHCVLLDEIHEHSTNAMVEFMSAGTKGRRQALIFMITNSGFDRTSVCFQYHDYGSRVASRQLDDDTFFAYVCAQDEGEDPFEDPTCRVKTNPSVDVTIPMSYLDKQVREALGMPAKESIVRRLNFCQWWDAENPWIDGDLWRACRKDGVDLAEMKGLPCYLGLDLGSKRDLLALGAAWRHPDGSITAATWFWTPADTLAERERLDRVPYGLWVEQGHLFSVPGRSIPFSFVAQFLATQILPKFDVQGLAFDQWRIDDFQHELDAIGIDNFIITGDEKEDARGRGLRMVRHGQGFSGGASESTLWMPRSITVLEDAILHGRFGWQKNPVLNHCSASVVLEADAQGNKKWNKRKSTGRIDGIVAVCQAVGLAEYAKDAFRPTAAWGQVSVAY